MAGNGEMSKSKANTVLMEVKGMIGFISSGNW